ncbi:DUF3742 family protein [Aromatoleum toluolicum]|uniref:DUF3742 family protein n=1 Tax=Aromatoleum toluolicum TaxID=90060 RepID=A0ABX1NBI0_9RHOO|nr:MULTISPECIES: DUF3742 family protein [Rhodocyclales]AYH45943.1 hypothetical protein CDA09_21625 [Azoarcus sp. DN11]NMF96614.1 DUF3742 family protein [Aromatoleum toluolicum]
MKPTAHTNFAERAGRTLGRMWRGIVRLDRKAHGLLIVQGWAPGVASAVLLVIKLVVLGVLAYASLWLAALLALLALAGWSVRDPAAWNAEDESKPEWREGHGGFGLYDKSEWRRDMGDPDNP